MKIINIGITSKIDRHPDLSWLGDYSNSPGPCAIDREEVEGRKMKSYEEYKYFNPGSNHCPPGRKSNWAHASESDIKKAFNGLTQSWKSREDEFNSIIELLDTYYMYQDYKRFESFSRGDWVMLGIMAEAEISSEGVIQQIRSGGLWGIESDSGGSYFLEVAEEQYDELAAILKDFGISKKDIPKFDEVYDESQMLESVSFLR